MEAPIRAGKRFSIVTLRISQVRQVDIFQQMDRPQLAFMLLVFFTCCEQCKLNDQPLVFEIQRHRSCEQISPTMNTFKLWLVRLTCQDLHGPPVFQAAGTSRVCALS